MHLHLHADRLHAIEHRPFWDTLQVEAKPDTSWIMRIVRWRQQRCQRCPAVDSLPEDGRLRGFARSQQDPFCREGPR